ncbi:hypothetical protein FA13DRAFT_448691 [Coprinellus micaceus]|uniref:Uncharacterized protein n=1 Tax=Coprinellus micaceus TaxID=71717 RepID=A0A4Y7U025_COPMI|nr:hypothetical protein FA13DRAFT_448691 [Coprinellus micaceus]
MGRKMLTNRSAHKSSLITLSSHSVTAHWSKPRCKDDENGGNRKEREQSNVLQNTAQMGFYPDLGNQVQVTFSPKSRLTLSYLFRNICDPDANGQRQIKQNDGPVAAPCFRPCVNKGHSRSLRRAHRHFPPVSPSRRI